MKKILKLSKQMTFSKGEIICHAGDPLEYLYIVHIGRVKIYRLFASGKEQLLRILEQGEVMGELSLFTEKTLEHYAEAIERTEICAIHRRDIQRLMQKHPSIPLKILSAFSHRLEETDSLVGELSYQDVATSLARYMVKLFENEATSRMTSPMCKTDLAAHLGTTQQAISRRLAHFQTNGSIEEKGQRHITVLNMDALDAIAHNY